MKKTFFALGLFALLMSSCTNNNSDKKTLNLSFDGLENLGADYVYEGWMVVDGEPITTGIFTVDDNGNLSSSSFELDAEKLENASTFVLTIEPANDPDPMPSATHVLAGDFSNDKASLSISHDAALAADFTDATGKYILATPTDGNGDMNEDSGVWFLDNSSGSPVAGLNLTELPNGWNYEGWVVLNGVPVSTGTFRSVNAADDNAPYSGTMAGPPFPGEDLLEKAPSGLSFPTSLLGATVVISIEPSPDNSPAPFTLKPLVSSVDSNAGTHSVLEMGNAVADHTITGQASR